MAYEIKYIAEPTPAQFHASDAFYRGIRGPVRSGKSSCCSVEIINRGLKQRPGPGGIRRVRAAVVRNTYRELLDTTIKTWHMWFPEAIFGSMNRGTMTHHIAFNDIELEVMFRALDRPEDVQKLMSMEVTYAWINEARHVPKAVVDVIGDRVGQFPPNMDEGCTWGGVFMDTNAPDEDHWWHELEDDPPEGWEFFVQPGALLETSEGIFIPNPKAENIRNLNEGHDYYLRRMAGKKTSYIRVYYANKYGLVEEGKLVHPEYSDIAHVSKVPLIPDPNLPVIVGMDFGLTPAATFFQQKPNGQWILFKEICSNEIGIRRFGQMELLPYVLTELLDYDMTIYGDPYGNAKSQNDRYTPQQIMEQIGFHIEIPTVEGGPTMRREALSAPLARMISGEPGLLIDPSCKNVRKGLGSKYIYKRIKVVGDDRYRNEPDKNWWSHVCESAQHAMLGAGEGERIVHNMPRGHSNKNVGMMDYGGWMAV